MKQYIYHILTIVLLFLTACEDVIEVKLYEEDLNLYAVEAKITTNDEPYVYVYKGIPVDNDGGFVGVSGAVVTVSDNQEPKNSVILVESSDENGYYEVPFELDYYGMAGREYTLTIELPDVTLSATEFLAPVEPIDSIQVRPSLRGDNRFLGVFTFGFETPGLGDYYKWDVYINNSLLKSAEYIVVASDEFVDGNYIQSLEIFTDFHNPAETDERMLQFMDEVQVKQTSISEFAYNYYFQMFNQSQTGFLFSVPPANIKGNIHSSEGKEVLGLFTAHDVSASNIVVIDESIENQLDERQ